MVLGHDVLTSDRTQDIKISENVSFDSMLLSPKILKGLKASGFYVPSPIQLHGIPLGKCGFDLLLEAKSGTGKTAVFVIIALEKLNLDKGLQTLMLAPTREIASQICDVIKTIGAYYEGLTVEVVMGGLPFEEDVEKFKKTVHIVVGSPGRLYHLIKHKHIDVSTVRLMVLDEADKLLLEKCFLSDINKIFSLLPSLKQMIMSSATYPDNIKTTMKNYVLNAHHICPESNSVLLGIEQNVTVVSSHVNIIKQTKNRYAELNKILTKIKFKQCLIFCNYQVRVGEVHKMLINDEWPADKLHGNQQQTDRLEALKILQEYKCRILVSTDLAARGIDASNVDLVVNFEIPYDWQTYLHRIGRAGRFGSYGRAISILCEDEQYKFCVRLRSLDIPFNLKHLWSKEPFLLDIPEIIEEICPTKENESLPEVKQSVGKLEIKEMHNELCEVLSVDSTQPNNEILNVPTFESLCESFEQAIIHSKIDNVASFSDLYSSFQSHEIKSNENFNCMSVEDKKLIIPCNMFNGNIILQSFQKHKSATSFTDKHMIKSVDKIKEKNTVVDEANDKKSTTIQDEKLHNGKTSGSIHHQSEPVHKDVSLPSTSKSSEYNTTIKSQGNRKAEINVNSYSRFGKVEPATRKVFPETSDSENYCDKSISITHKSDDDHATPFISSEYNDCEKAMLAANLPIAFGKTKQNKQSTTNRDISRKTHFSRNSLKNNECKISSKNKTVFTKNYVKQQSDSVYESSDTSKTEDELVSQAPKLVFRKPSESDNNHNHRRSLTVPTQINVKQRVDTVIESSDTDKTEDESITQLYKPLKGKKSSKDNSLLHKRNKTVLTKSNIKKGTKAYKSSEDEKSSIESVSLPYRSHIGNVTANSQNTTRNPINNNHCVNNDFSYVLQLGSAIQERQRQFDCWYHELQTNMQALERSVYIEEIKRLNRLF